MLLTGPASPAMKPEERNNPTSASNTGVSNTALSALALAKGITGDTLVGVPRKPRLPQPVNTPPPFAVRGAPGGKVPAPNSTGLPKSSVTYPAQASIPSSVTVPPIGIGAPTEAPRCESPVTTANDAPPTASAATIRAFTLMLKFSIAASIVGGIGYVTAKNLVPVLKELANPTPVAPGQAPDSEAPVFVKAIQQTRQVVAKNDSNVARLDALIADPNGTGDLPPVPENQYAVGAAPQIASEINHARANPVGAAQLQPPAPVKVSVYSPDAGPVEVTATQSQTSKLSKEMIQRMSGAVTNLQVNGIRNGTTPRVVIGGILFRVGDMVDYELELTFSGIDTAKRELRFTTPEGDVFSRSY